MRELIDRDDAIEAVNKIRKDWKESGQPMKVYGADYIIAALRSLPAADKGEGRHHEFIPGSNPIFCASCGYVGHNPIHDTSGDAAEST